MHCHWFHLCLLVLAGVTLSASLPPGVISIPLRRIDNQSAYGVEIQVGTPPQRSVTKADTGSFTYAFESPLNEICKRKRDLCVEYGVYDNTSSSTTKWINSRYYDMLSDQGYGSMMNDTLSIGGQTFQNMNFGVVESYTWGARMTDQQAAIFGLGADCATKACNSSPTFIQQLFDRGAISKRAFSFYLGPNNSTADGVLLIGGIDLAKRHGRVFKRKVWDPTTKWANGQPNWVPVNGMSLELSKGTGSNFTYKKGSSVLWDTGSPRWYLPSEMYGDVRDYFGIPTDVPEGPRLKVDCTYRNPTSDTLVVDFGEGAEIRVPLHHLVTKLSDTNCVVDLGKDVLVFGDAFLREVYFTFDYDDLTVEFSAVKYTEKTDIVKI